MGDTSSSTDKSSTSPDNSLINFLRAANQVQRANSTAVKALEIELDVLAGLAGGIGIAIGAADFLSQLLADTSPNEIQQAVAAIEAALDAHFRELYVVDGIAEMENLRREIAFELTAPQGDLDQLQSEPSKPFLDPAKVFSECLGPLDTLARSSFWEIATEHALHFRPQYPWRYAGGGLPDPTLPFDTTSLLGGGQLTFVNVDPVQGQVFQSAGDHSFNYCYILPEYLRAIYLALAVGLSLEPAFVTTHADKLRDAITTLNDGYVRARDGIVCVAAPNIDDLIPIKVLVPYATTRFAVVALHPGYAGMSLWDAATASPDDSVDPASIASVTPSAFARPYGALHRDSGYAGDLDAGRNTVRSYPEVELPEGYGLPGQSAFPPPHDGPGRFPPVGFYTQFCSVYLVRTLRLYKQVYRDIGLSSVVSALNTLCDLLGDFTPVGGTRVVDAGAWSLAEALRLLGWRRLTWYPGYPRDLGFSERAFDRPSLRQLGRYLARVSGAKVAFTSFRQMLEAS